MDVIVFEGARGAGKSTVARSIRDSIAWSTLINPTGFQEDGEEGLLKIERYYKAWESFLEKMSDVKNQTVIFDRFFFSEMVYSPLYKNYDFYEMYNKMCKALIRHADTVQIYFLTVEDKTVLYERLKRDKVELFGYVEESVEQTLLQQALYKKLFDRFMDQYVSEPNLDLFRIDTSILTPDEIKQMILKE